jgi:hypothetical protein
MKIHHLAINDTLLMSFMRLNWLIHQLYTEEETPRIRDLNSTSQDERIDVSSS